jgi:putative ABC transport system permease protein
MSPLQTLRVAIRALFRNKMRSFLTTLGIIIGVSAVIAMVAIGEGAKAQVEAQFAAMGSNLLIVLPGSTTSGGMRGGFGSMPTLTWDDLRAIRTEVPTVRYAAPQLASGAQLQSEDQNWSTRVYGTTPEFFRIRNWSVATGSPMSDSDAEGGTKVVFLGQTVVNNLFGPNANPVGQIIRIKNVPFEVKGVLATKGQSSWGMDYDDVAFIPLKTFQTKIQGGLQQYIAGQIYVGATSEAATARAQVQIANLLRDRHHIGQGQEDDFSIRNLTELASAQEDSTKTMTTLLAAIAAVALLVGGIGIMNIMLVSVTERTREIGVRMAVGAKPRNILAQFLVEALTLATAGGFIGIVLGVVFGRLLAARFHWPMLMRPDIIVISVVFSAVVGIVFGLYPAQKASRLDPIEALRFE